MKDVAVIGAGWAGLTAAAALAEQGMDVVVVEKARGPGGRCATRRQSALQFDHGAQYFTARSEAFREAVGDWQSRGWVAEWQPQIEVIGEKPSGTGRSSPDARLVGVPGMNGVLRQLAEELDCRYRWQVAQLQQDSAAAGWTLIGSEGQSLQARRVLITAPPAQVLGLIGQAHPLADLIGSVTMNPCWALMLGFDRPIEAPFDAAFVNRGPLSWIARDSDKPGRTGEAWLAHASGEWSRQWLEADFDQAADALLEAFIDLLPQAGNQPPSLISAHRWRFSMAANPLNQNCLQDPDQGLFIAGDWLAGNRVEGAWSSGRAAAEAILKA
ncbi:MAG: NAD(P)/FAD-dependent oxidoreductase [Wenzhouxiangella sp.]